MTDRAALPRPALLAVLLALAAAPAGAEEPDWLDRVPDAYDGEIFSGADNLGGTTEFTRGADGLAGRYGFTEQTGAVIEGVLEACRAAAEHVLTCRWRDTYGAGGFTARFTPDLQAFEGFWTPDGLDELRHPWWGRRRLGS